MTVLVVYVYARGNEREKCCVYSTEMGGICYRSDESKNENPSKTPQCESFGRKQV